MKSRVLLAALVSTASLYAMSSLPAQPMVDRELAPQQQGIVTTLSGNGNKAPHIAIPEFIALTADAETRDAARLMAQVLFDDLKFEREFDPIPLSAVSHIPVARTIDAIPFAQWADAGADAVAFATISKAASGFTVDFSVLDVASHKEWMHRQYSGAKAARFVAHTISDEMHKARGVDGVARTKIAFASDRDGERMSKTIQDRTVQEIYVMDYDGENQTRVTPHRSLDISPAWSPDGKSLMYTSYFYGTPDIFIQNIYGQVGPPGRPVKSPTNAPNQYAAWSPDGKQIAFSSDRDQDGFYEIWIANRDGSGLRRLLNDKNSISEAPAWDPTGRRLAFVSDRTGSAQIYTVSIDGTDLTRITRSETACDRPTWNPSPSQTEIAYTAQNSFSGHDIHLYSFATQKITSLTDGQGTNESPSFSSNGRHVVFTTTRWGKSQLAIVGRDGKMEIKRLTSSGNNKFPSWARSIY